LRGKGEEKENASLLILTISNPY